MNLNDSVTPCVSNCCEEDAITEAMTSDDDSLCADVPTYRNPVPPSLTFQVAKPKAMDPMEHFSNHVANEWMKLERFLSQCRGAHTDSDLSNNMLVIPSTSVVGLVDIAKRSATATLVEKEISCFIAVVQPIIDGLDEIMDLLNMKDPTRC